MSFYYLESIRNIYNSKVERHVTLLKDGQIICIKISRKKIYKWSLSTWKNAQHHQVLDKCKPNAQCDTTSHLLALLQYIYKKYKC